VIKFLIFLHVPLRSKRILLLPNGSEEFMVESYSLLSGSIMLYSLGIRPPFFLRKAFC